MAADRKAVALVLATAIAVPMEGVRQWASRKAKRPMFCPSSLQTASNEVYVNFERVGPIRNTHRFSVYGYKSVNSPIALLGFLVGPNAVIFAVPGAVVESFNRVANRRLPHISQEISKVSPLIADVNTAPTIVGPLLAVWVCASLNYSVPSVMGSSGRCPVSSFLFRPNFTCETPATLCLTRVEILCRRDGGISTLANTVPPLKCRRGNSRKSAKYIASRNCISTFGIAGMTAKKSIFSREARARKCATAANARLGNDRHKCSRKMM